MSQRFIVTKEHRRFVEFATAVRKEHTIGICHGDAGVGKTLSARRYAHWDTLEPYITEWGPRTEEDATHHATANRTRTVFCTPRSYLGTNNSCARSSTYKSGSGSASMNTNAASVKSPAPTLATWPDGPSC